MNPLTLSVNFISQFLQSLQKFWGGTGHVGPYNHMKTQCVFMHGVCVCVYIYYAMFVYRDTKQNRLPTVIKSLLN